MRLISLFLILGLLPWIYFTVSPAFAHVPEFEEEGKSLEEAVPVENPAKSRVLYSQFESSGDVDGENGEDDENGENIRYYSFEMKKGERIYLSLIIPAPAPENFVPELALLGPGISLPETRPENLEIPAGYGAVILPGQLPEKATYEGFTPSAFYTLASLDLEAPKSGTYYAVVRGEEGGPPPSGSGNYGLVLGYLEIFSLSEWLLVPAAQLKIYRWQGQSLPQIFAPLALTLLLGGLGFKRGKRQNPIPGPASRMAAFAALFFLGTGASLLFQMLLALSLTGFSPEAFITLFLALSHIVLGSLALFPALRPGKTVKKRKGFLPYSRIYFIGLGFVGLFLWAGLYAGPLLAIIAGLMPERGGA